MKKILITAPYMLKTTERPFVEGLLKDLPFDVKWENVQERLEEEDLLRIIDQYEGVICGDDRFTEKVYKKATNLKVLVKWGTGIDSLNKDIADKFNIKICNTPNAFTQPVSETTIGYMLAFNRAMMENDDCLKNGGWEKPQGYTLAEKTIGIIGVGNIGQEVARKLKAFGSRVLINDLKKIDNAIISNLGVEVATKEKIYAEADMITLHTDLNKESYQMIGSEQLNQMKKFPFIINTSRGDVIKESDLIQALQSKKIQGAGLDVFEHEPLALNSPLRSMKNVLLAAHNSNSSPACWKRVHINSVNMLKENLL